MTDATLVEPGAIGGGEAVIVDCRFDLTRPAAGREKGRAVRPGIKPRGQVLRRGRVRSQRQDGDS